MIRDTVRDFAQQRDRARAAEIDRSGIFPVDIFKQMAELGLMGLPIPEELRGVGADYTSYCLALEEITRACGSTGLTYEAHISLGCMPIYLFGTEEQKQEYLPLLCSGESMGSFGLTEPEAGSDAGGTKTTAVLRGWRVGHQRLEVLHHQRELRQVRDHHRGDRQGQGHTWHQRHHRAHRNARGSPFGRATRSWGFTAPTRRELFFDDVRVPEKNLVGVRGEGFKQFLEVLDGGRIAIGAMGVGIAQACLDAALKYAKERVQFGQPIGKFQAIQFKLADIAMNIELARLMYLKAAWLKDTGQPYAREANYAKLFGSEMATKAALEAIQIHGGYGYINEFPVERYLRDAKLLEIGEGTSEVIRLVIARSLGL